MEQMCTAVFAFLESAKPFFQYGKPLQELLPFFVRALGGILPLDALAIVRMEGKKGVCETACWSGTPHLPEALMLRAFNGKEFPKAFDTPFSEEALAALFPEETAGKLNWLVLPIACDADALGLLFVGRESGETEWPDRERDFLRLVCAMLGFFFAGKAKFLHKLLIRFVLDAVYRTNLHQIGARRECGRRSTLGRGESVCVKNTCGGNIFVPKLRSYCGDVHAS